MEGSLSLHIAYCTATYPCRSETFLSRELAMMPARGVTVSVWALRGEAGFVPSADNVAMEYRPRRCSRQAWTSLAWLVVRHPVRFTKIVWECIRITGCSPRLALMLLANMHAVAWFARRAEESGVTLIHGYFLNLPGLLAMCVSIAAGIPFTLAGHAHDVFVDGAAVSRLVRLARCLVLCHASAAEALKRHISSTDYHKLRVIHHGLNLEHWPERSPRDRNACPHTIIAAGRFVPKKGYACLIRAFAQLRRRLDRAQLVMVGHGPLSSALRQLAEQEAVADCITWAGWLDGQTFQHALSAASVLVVPSVIAENGDRDGIPNVLLEAWAVGVPVIASSLPALTEAVEDQVHGLLVHPNDIRQLADAMVRLLEDSTLQASLARKGRQRLNEEYDLRKNVTVLLSTLTKARHG